MCECGCGEATTVATITQTRKGWAKGKPVRFIRGHQSRRRSQVVEGVECFCCPACKEWRPIDGFSRSSTSPSGRQSRCRPCQAELRPTYDLRKYGLTPEEYGSRLVAQGGKCAICLATDPGGKGRFHVDHDHVSGGVRGLLCHGCNTALGLLGDSPSRLRSAADYIERAL